VVVTELKCHQASVSSPDVGSVVVKDMRSDNNYKDLRMLKDDDFPGGVQHRMWPLQHLTCNVNVLSRNVPIFTRHCLTCYRLFRLHRMHEMRTISDDRGVCQSVCHVGSFGVAFANYFSLLLCWWRMPLPTLMCKETF